MDAEAWKKEILLKFFAFVQEKIALCPAENKTNKDLAASLNISPQNLSEIRHKKLSGDNTRLFPRVAAWIKRNELLSNEFREHMPKIQQWLTANGKDHTADRTVFVTPKKDKPSSSTPNSSTSTPIQGEPSSENPSPTDGLPPLRRSTTSTFGFIYILALPSMQVTTAQNSKPLSILKVGMGALDRPVKLLKEWFPSISRNEEDKAIIMRTRGYFHAWDEDSLRTCLAAAVGGFALPSPLIETAYSLLHSAKPIPANLGTSEYLAVDSDLLDRIRSFGADCASPEDRAEKMTETTALVVPLPADTLEFSVLQLSPSLQRYLTIKADLKRLSITPTEQSESDEAEEEPKKKKK